MILRRPKGHPLRENREGEEEGGVRTNEEKEESYAEDAEEAWEGKETGEDIKGNGGNGEKGIAKIKGRSIGREEVDASRAEEGSGDRTPEGNRSWETPPKVTEESNGNEDEGEEGDGENGDSERTQMCEGELAEECGAEDVFPEETPPLLVIPGIIEGVLENFYGMHCEETANSPLCAKTGIEVADITDEEGIGAFLEETRTMKPSCQNKSADGGGAQEFKLSQKAHMGSEEDGKDKGKEEEESSPLCEEGKSEESCGAIPVPRAAMLPPTDEEAQDGEGNGEDEHIVIDAGGEEYDARECRTEGEEEEGRPSTFLGGEEEKGDPEEEEERNNREEESKDLKSEWLCIFRKAEEAAHAEPHCAKHVVERGMVKLPSPEGVGEGPMRQHVADVFEVPIRIVPADGVGSHEEVDEAEEGGGEEEVGERTECWPSSEEPSHKKDAISHECEEKTDEEEKGEWSEASGGNSEPSHATVIADGELQCVLPRTEEFFEIDESPVGVVTEGEGTISHRPPVHDECIEAIVGAHNECSRGERGEIDVGDDRYVFPVGAAEERETPLLKWPIIYAIAKHPKVGCHSDIPRTEEKEDKGEGEDEKPSGGRKLPWG